MDLTAVLAIALVVALVVAAGAILALVTASATRRRPAPAATDPVVVAELARARQQLDQMATLVTDLRNDGATLQGRLEAGLAEAARQTTRLSDTADALRRALASPATRGQWGERMAVDVLRAAGFVEGVNYRTQTGIDGGTIPDVTFLLPGDRLLHMDVKFPFDNYLRALEATTDAERDAFEARFVADVRQRVNEITTRGYIDPQTTVDQVLLFIPNEAVFAALHDRDPAIVDHAIARKVVICSPSTLFAVLAVIRQAVEQFRLERTGNEILACLVAFEKEWRRYGECVDALGRQMATATRTYETLASTRTNQLERTLKRVEVLRTEHAADGSSPLALLPVGDDGDAVAS